MNLKIKNNQKCKKRRRARKIKITVTTDTKRRVILPGIPFWLLDKLVSLGLLIFRISQSGKKRKINITEREVFEILEVLKCEEPFTLVEVVDRKGNFVEIKTM